MTDTPTASNVLPFQKIEARRPSSTERIWGKAVVSHGYTGIPSILIQAQRRLRLNPVKMNIIVQLLDYWREPERQPFPSKKELADRIGITEKTVQNNIRALEKDHLIERRRRYTRHGDPDSNIYDLGGLVGAIQEIEPDFAEARRKKKEARIAAERGRRRQ